MGSSRLHNYWTDRFPLLALTLKWRKSTTYTWITDNHPSLVVMPDDFFYDHHKHFVAVELKTRKGRPREIVTGIGQCILALTLFPVEASYLVIPKIRVTDNLKAALELCPYLGLVSYGAGGVLRIEVEPREYLKRAATLRTSYAQTIW